VSEVPLIDLEPDQIKSPGELVLALKPTLNGLATSVNSICKILRPTKVTADEANQRSKTNQWLIGILLVADLGLFGAIVGGVL